MFFGDVHYCKSTAVDYINSLCQISHESLPTNFSRRLQRVAITRRRNWLILKEIRDIKVEHVRKFHQKTCQIISEKKNFLNIWLANCNTSKSSQYIRDCLFQEKMCSMFFLIFPRNFTELVKITVWTDISCQDQWLQDTFASIQQRIISGTVWEWRCMAPNKAS